MTQNDVDPPFRAKLDRILKPLTAKHAEVYAKAIGFLPLVLSSAYTQTGVLRGGDCVDKRYPDKILGACPTYSELTSQQKEEIKASIPELASNAISGLGTPSDELMESM